MYSVDVVRFGSVAAGVPVVGTVYAQLVEDWLTGQPTRPAVDMAVLTGLSAKQVSRSFDTLVSWGLVAKAGSTRMRKVVVSPVPNLVFCEAVVEGVFGPEVLGEVRLGARAAELLSTTDHGDAVASYAVAVLVSRYAGRGFYSTKLTEPSHGTGTGYVVLHNPDTHWECQNDRSGVVNLDNQQMSTGHLLFCKLLSLYNKDVHISISKEQMSTGHLLQLAAYPTDQPIGTLDLPVAKNPKQRAAQRRGNRYSEIPSASNGFLYWPNDKLPLDTDYYPAVLDLLAYANDVFESGERLTWKLYIPLRECLVEEAFDLDDLKRAIRECAHHDFWRTRMVTVYKLCSNPQVIRELLAKKGHDRYARGMTATPSAEPVAVEF